ncbi:MAG TPA: DUF4032 domain-containing protein [Kofleriaceae bacterium]|nr:DUF4032 domain-containing protein [Kofleriaceae bacterium]
MTRDATPRLLSLRPDHPDFLDLPWGLPLAEWAAGCERVEELPRGASRHPVVFVSYDAGLYALKELPPEVAEREYDLLRRLEELRLPAVRAVGYALTRTPAGEASVLVTRYLDHAMPYSEILSLSSGTRYDSLVQPLAGLLVQLHLSGVYWGDCSLANTLFRRDVGALQAYLVDAETAEVRPQQSPAMRAHDLDIMEENLAGGLADLAAAGRLGKDVPVFTMGAAVRERYQRLWDEVTKVVILDRREHYRIEERIRALNELGFSVGEVMLEPTEKGNQLRMQVLVTDRTFHRDQLASLTGISAEETQAQRMMNEIQELRAAMADERIRTVPLAVAAYHWLTHFYQPIVERVAPLIRDDRPPQEVYCQVLEHKWYLSERAGHDVGHDAATEDLLAKVAGG